MHIICYNAGDGRISPLTEFAERQDLYMVKRILCVLLCFALLCSFAGCKKEDVTPAPDGEQSGNPTDEPNNPPSNNVLYPSFDPSDECYPYGMPVVNELPDDATAKGIADYLKENNKISKTFFLFDYEGDDFDFTYYLITAYGKKQATDLYDLVSPSKSQGCFDGHIILNNYECQCNEITLARWGECEVHYANLYNSWEDNVHPDACVLKYTVWASKIDSIPGTIDASLLTFEPEFDDDYNIDYYVKYDGQVICVISTCVPLDDTIRSLFTEHLVIYEKT